MGMRNSLGVCVGSLTVEIGQLGVDRYPNGAWVYAKGIRTRQYIMTSAENLDSLLLDAAEAAGRDFANYLLKAKSENAPP